MGKNPAVWSFKLLLKFLYAGCVYHTVTHHLVTWVTVRVRWDSESGRKWACMTRARLCVRAQCEGDSMYPTINSSGSNDVVIVEMITRKRYKLKKWDGSDKKALEFSTFVRNMKWGSDVFSLLFCLSTTLRGDVVVLRQPDIPEELICKRIVMEEGERIPDNCGISHQLSAVSFHYKWVCYLCSLLLCWSFQRSLVVMCGWKETISKGHMTHGFLVLSQ